jgi:Zn-dependent protease with chaperone function
LLAINRGLFLRLLCQFRIYVPAEPRLRQIVADTSARMRVPVSATWQLPSVSANAFALVTSRELLFTTRLLEICSDAELAAICSHELAHLAEPKSIRRRRQLYALVGIFPFIFIVPAFHAFGVAGLMLPYFGVLYRRLLSTKLSQRMEQRADLMALSEQASAGVYARALGKLYEANHMPAVSGRTTAAHPHLFDRMVAAGITPDYARPSAPDRSNWLGELLNAAAVIIGVVNLILFFRRMDPSAGD